MNKFRILFLIGCIGLIVGGCSNWLEQEASGNRTLGYETEGGWFIIFVGLAGLITHISKKGNVMHVYYLIASFFCAAYLIWFFSSHSLNCLRGFTALDAKDCLALLRSGFYMTFLGNIFLLIGSIISVVRSVPPG